MILENNGHHFRNNTDANNDDSQIDVEVQIIAAVAVSVVIMGCLYSLCGTCSNPSAPLHYVHEYTEIP
jgi:hypothetical protein